jgi:hypothetical protein
VVRGVDLDAAEIRDERARIERVGIDERARREAPRVEAFQHAEQECEEKAGELEQNRQLLVDVRRLVGSRLGDIAAERRRQLGE